MLLGSKFQVFRIPPEEAFGGDCRPDLTLGTAVYYESKKKRHRWVESADLSLSSSQFVNGKDDDHFCKPTSVAVREDASAFYVADGYCNSRWGVGMGAGGQLKEFQHGTSNSYS